jgi:LacI family transcriptional regulator
MRPRKGPTLKEFAARLGLSPTTVSRALGGYPEVREATRRRVIEAAAEMGYRPNRRAAALATGRAMAIGHVVPMSYGHERVNPVFGDFVAGAAEIYAREGYDMIMSMPPDGAELEAYRHLAGAGSVDGLIVHSPHAGDARLGFLHGLGVPFVVHGRMPAEAGRPYPFVDIDNRRSTARMVDHLAGLGHRRIALVNGLEHMDFAVRRRQGYEGAMAAHGLARRPELVASGEMTERYGHAAAAAMLDLAEPPTAFSVCSLVAAIGVRRAVEERGMRLGADVSVGIHDDDLSYLGNGDPDDPAGPVFTCTRSSIRAAGRRCAEILLEGIREPATAPVQEVWECALVPGRSTGPPPRA